MKSFSGLLMLCLLSSGSALAQAAPATPGQIPKWDGLGGLTDSAIFDDGTGNIGIGTNFPRNQLEIAGADNSLALSNIPLCGGGMGTVMPMNCTNYQFLGQSNGSTFINSSGLGGIAFRHNNSEAAQMTIAPNGNVGIGTIFPAFQLDVVNSLGGTGVHGTGVSGVFGESPAFGGNGVIGEANNGPIAWGVWGRSSSGEAGHFTGRVVVTGRFDSPDKHFKIDHPLDPANKYMVHASVESAERMNIYNGMVTLDRSGEATVALPEWFEALNRDFRYQLTSIGSFAPVYIAEEISGNQFKIAGGNPGAKISWQVTGVRHDAYAIANPMEVEEVKPASEKGYYLHPALFGQGEEKGIDWAHRPEIMRQIKAQQK